MIKFLLFCGVAYFLIKPAILVYLENKKREEENMIKWMKMHGHMIDPVKISKPTKGGQ